jgi:hypothetical protein
MTAMRTTVALLSLVVGATILGCISGGGKAMNVSLQVTDTDYQTQEVDGSLNVTVTLSFTAENSGDPGVVEVSIKVYDEIDDVFGSTSKDVHLATGETKTSTVTVEGVAPLDADLESYYPIVSEKKHRPD